MVDLSDIKQRAQEIKRKVSGDDDNLGPDRGTMDQLEARKERARMEARREAKREQREQAIEEAREQGRQQATGGSGIVSKIENVAEEIEAGSDGDAGFGGSGADLEDMGFGGGGGGDAGLDAGFGGGQPGDMNLGGGFGGGGGLDDDAFGADLEDMGFGDDDGDGGML